MAEHPTAGYRGNVEQTLARRGITKIEFEENVWKAFKVGEIEEAKGNVTRYVVIQGPRFSLNQAFRANGIDPAYGATSVSGRTANTGDMMRAAQRLGLDVHWDKKLSTKKPKRT